jgi:hypothetical protein
MLKKIRNIRMDDATAKRLKAAAVEYEMPQGDLLKRLLDMLDHAKPELIAATILNDVDDEGRIVAEGPEAVDREHVDDVLGKTRRKAALIDELKELSDDTK